MKYGHSGVHTAHDSIMTVRQGVVCGEQRTSKTLPCGVPQGSVLEPNLLNMEVHPGIQPFHRETCGDSSKEGVVVGNRS